MRKAIRTVPGTPCPLTSAATAARDAAWLTPASPVELEVERVDASAAQGDFLDLLDARLPDSIPEGLRGMVCDAVVALLR